MEIDNSQDLIESRDVIKCTEELQDERDGLAQMLEEAKQEIADCEDESDKPNLREAFQDAQDELEQWDNDNQEELKNLKALEDGINSSEWRHGLTLIRETYFADYCREMCEDIGDIPKNLPSYIENAIDWDKVARQLKQDYSTVEYDGVTYYYRD